MIKSVNPASWMTADLLQEELDSPSFTPGLTSDSGVALGQRRGQRHRSGGVGGLRQPRRRHPRRAEGVHIGIDLGWRRDCTAFVPVCRIEEGRVGVGMPTILVPPQDGSSLDAEEVFGVATMMRDRWPDCTFVLDPAAGGEQLAQRIDNELRAPVMTHRQQPGPMCGRRSSSPRPSPAASLSIPTRGLQSPDLAGGAKFVGASGALPSGGAAFAD